MVLGMTPIHTEQLQIYDATQSRTSQFETIFKSLAHFNIHFHHLTILQVENWNLYLL